MKPWWDLSTNGFPERPTPSVESAIDVMARVVLASGIHHAEWENYPEIGEHDWNAIIERAVEMAHGPSAEAFKRAYELLTARAAQSGRSES